MSIKVMFESDLPKIGKLVRIFGELQRVGVISELENLRYEFKLNVEDEELGEVIVDNVCDMGFVVESCRFNEGFTHIIIDKYHTVSVVDFTELLFDDVDLRVIE